MSSQLVVRFVPALVLGLGAALTTGIDRQRPMPLVAALDSVIPRTISGYRAQNVPLSEAEQAAAGMDEYVLRTYTSEFDTAGFSLYVGYYEQQTQGRTIHTPRNCLPGGGWEALTSTYVNVETALGSITVNDYLLRRGTDHAHVVYWYQGRGRVEANEYRVKWNLLVDAAARGRSEEALARIVVPVVGDPARAAALAQSVAQAVIPSIAAALPE